MPNVWNNENTTEITVNYTGSATLNETLNPKTGFELVSFAIENATSPATSEDLTVKIIALNASSADEVVFRQDMDAVDDIYTTWDNMKQLVGDKVDLDWANTNTVTYKITIQYRRINSWLRRS